MSITKREAMKEIRACAKRNGLTFKQMNTQLNGGYLYKFVERGNGETVLSNCTFWSAYGDVLDGYIDSWNGERFEGVETL